MLSLSTLKLLQLRGCIATGLQHFDEAIAYFQEGIEAADHAVSAGQDDAGPWADALQNYLAKALLAGNMKETKPAIEEARSRSSIRVESE
jgi:hypothetical protein